MSKRLNRLAQIFCRTSRDHREDLRMIKIFKKCVLNVLIFSRLWLSLTLLNNNLFSENVPHTHTRRCCVYNCLSNNTMDEMKFYMFPKDPSQREVCLHVSKGPESKRSLEKCYTSPWLCNQKEQLHVHVTFWVFGMKGVMSQLWAMKSQ